MSIDLDKVYDNIAPMNVILPCKITKFGKTDQGNLFAAVSVPARDSFSHPQQYQIWYSKGDVLGEVGDLVIIQAELSGYGKQKKSIDGNGQSRTMTFFNMSLSFVRLV